MSLSVLQGARSSYAAAFALAFAALLASALCAAPARARQAAQQGIKLDKIEFKGLERVKESDALEKSGLKVGQTVTIDELDAVANSLLASGLFKNLSYSVKGKTDKALLVFTVIEQTETMPVAFDNFVWFTDEELREAIRRKVPSFDGNAPVSGNTAEQIKQSLQDLLRERKIEGTVEYNLSSDVSGRNVEQLFGVKDAGLRVCKINYVGSRALSEELLVQKSGGILDNDYSRTYIRSFVETNLLPLYRERGYLRASFADPKAKAESNPDCEKGVALTMYVDEGSIYVWDKAAWEGAQAFTAQELDAALAMKNREIANVVKIEKGLNAVRRAYGRKGYLAARVRAVPEYDDSNRSVSFAFKVEEGPRYTMGDLFIDGLPESEANNLRGRWSLLHGEPFEEGYVEQFVKKKVPEFVKDSLRAGNVLPPMKVGSKTTPDNEKHTVNVTLEFKPDPAQQKPAAASAPSP